jgi:hypothetical protein
MTALSYFSGNERIQDVLGLEKLKCFPDNRYHAVD